MTDLGATYLARVTELMQLILDEEGDQVAAAADLLADQIAADRLVHVYGPGGHSNLASQEIFFRAGGLMHVSAILDEGTLLSSGALRSMAIERTLGYGRVVIDDRGLGRGPVRGVPVDVAATCDRVGHGEHAGVVSGSERWHAPFPVPAARGRG